MNIFSFLKISGKRIRKPINDQKQEVLVRMGREQFKKLIERGISIPVVLL